MREQMTRWYIAMQMKMKNFLEDFAEEEKGAADIVAIIMVIVVVIAVAVVFKDNLERAMQSIMDKLNEFVGY